MAQSESSRDETRRFRELKKQNEKLKRENAALEKKIKQLELYTEKDPYEDDLKSISKSAKKPKSKPAEYKPTCPKCGSYEVVLFQLMEKQYFNCRDCTGKGPLK